MSANLLDALSVARRVARRAGAAAIKHYGWAEAEAKDGGSPVTAADHAANDIIVREIRSEFPDDAILSEESKDSSDRLEADRVWIVDPLDGTKEFLAQNGEFSIMIGLVVDAPPGGGPQVSVNGEAHGIHAKAGKWPPRMVGSACPEP